MRCTFLIARQEFIKYVTRRGFVISILMFPLWIVLVTLVPQWTGGGPQQRIFTVVDRAGGHYAEAILRALATDNAERELKALSRYAAANANADRLSHDAPKLADILSTPDSASSFAAYEAMGGRFAALAKMRPALKPRARPFLPPAPRFIYADPPRRLAGVSEAGFTAAVKPFLTGDDSVIVDGGRARLFAAILIPADFSKSGQAQYISGDLSDSELNDFISAALGAERQRDALHRLAPQLNIGQVLDVSADLQARNPVRSSQRDSSIDSIVPIALAIILFVVSVMNASVLLQGVVEEKSTRMIEVLLSCATPREITTGKLIGVIAVALTTLIIWGLALLALMAIASQDTVSLVFASLRAVATPGMLPLLLVYFLCGLLIYGSLFLAIGSMANSLADAQSLLGPSMLILMLPNLMIAGVMRDPNGALASTLSWVPVYTPFFMMLRIASNPPVWQLWGTLALALATTVLMVIWTGRVFARHVLTTERPPSLGALFGGMFGRRA
jgi:ABC-2 type transport system permease protein